MDAPRGSDRPALEKGYRNLRLELSYDGLAFHGYQFQPHVKTVQGVLIEAWKTLTGEEATFYACSRLDAGVSATQFVLNVHTKTPLDEERILRALNGILHQNMQEPICIYKVSLSKDEFHARFDTKGKHYRYLVWYGYGLHALLSRRAWVVRSRIAPGNLEHIFKTFVGEHDFSAFRAQDCTAKSTVRKIDGVDVWQHPRFEELAIIDFWGEGFLKNMIRNMVGTAVEIAIQKLPQSAIVDAFQHKERTRMGQCAPAHALRLEHVYYESELYRTHAKQGARDYIPS